MIKVWVRVAVWEIIDSRRFGTAGTQEEQLALSILALRASLMNWYKARHRLNPDEKLTRVPDFNARLVGKKSDPLLRSKGAESYGLLLWCIDILKQYNRRISQWQHLLQAGEHLARIVAIWKENSDSWTIPKAGCEDTWGETILT